MKVGLKGLFGWRSGKVEGWKNERIEMILFLSSFCLVESEKLEEWKK